jgi:hypothetical protein
MYEQMSRAYCTLGSIILCKAKGFKSAPCGMGLKSSDTMGITKLQDQHYFIRNVAKKNPNFSSIIYRLTVLACLQMSQPVTKLPFKTCNGSSGRYPLSIGTS